MTASIGAGSLATGARRRLSAVVVPGTPANTVLRAGLASMVAASTLLVAWRLLRTYPLAVDLEIPLRAAERWIQGAPPYLASSFEVTSGAGQPFLYPPFVLPVVAPFSLGPRAIPIVLWGAVCLVAALWTARRLALPAWSWPILLAWPPFAEALLGLNVQVPIFAAFVALFYADPGRGNRLRDRDVGADPPSRGGPPGRPALVDGLLGVAIVALKTSQVQPFVYALRRRPRAALAAVAVTALAVLATVPLTGAGLWADWIAQVRRAAQPGLIGGISFLEVVPLPVGLLVAAASIGLVFAVPRRHAGAWIGLLTLVASPNLHYFGLLFALPAMLVVRREIGLVAALSISLFTRDGAWLGVALVSAALLLGELEPRLLEPASDRALPLDREASGGVSSAS